MVRRHNSHDRNAMRRLEFNFIKISCVIYRAHSTPSPRETLLVAQVSSTPISAAGNRLTFFAPKGRFCSVFAPNCQSISIGFGHPRHRQICVGGGARLENRGFRAVAATLHRRCPNLTCSTGLKPTDILASKTRLFRGFSRRFVSRGNRRSSEQPPQTSLSGSHKRARLFHDLTTQLLR